MEMVPAQLWDGKGLLTVRRRSDDGAVKGRRRLVSVGRRKVRPARGRERSRVKDREREFSAFEILNAIFNFFKSTDGE